MIEKNLSFNRDAVIETAKLLNDLFIKYCETSEDARNAYSQCKPLLEKCINGEITEPSSIRCDIAYFSPEFELIEFKDLYRAASELDVYLEGWGSIEEFNEYMEKIIPQ